MKNSFTTKLSTKSVTTLLSSDLEVSYGVTGYSVNGSLGSDMWQDCQIPSHQAKSSYWSVDPDPTWKRPPGRPRTKWTDQLRRDNNNVPIATLWRQAIGRGHSRATLRPEPTTR